MAPRKACHPPFRFRRARVLPVCVDLGAQQRERFQQVGALFAHLAPLPREGVQPLALPTRVVLEPGGNPHEMRVVT